MSEEKLDTVSRQEYEGFQQGIQDAVQGNANAIKHLTETVAGMVPVVQQTASAVEGLRQYQAQSGRTNWGLVVGLIGVVFGVGGANVGLLNLRISPVEQDVSSNAIHLNQLEKDKDSHSKDFTELKVELARLDERLKAEQRVAAIAGADRYRGKDGERVEEELRRQTERIDSLIREHNQ